MIAAEPVGLEEVHRPDDPLTMIRRPYSCETYGLSRFTLGPKHVEQGIDLFVAEELVHVIKKLVQKMSSTTAIRSPL